MMQWKRNTRQRRMQTETKGDDVADMTEYDQLKQKDRGKEDMAKDNGNCNKRLKWKKTYQS